MADVFSINERVSTTNALYAVWRLTRTLKSAGWTVVQSGDGTSFGATDYWTTYAGLGTSSWIVVSGPGGRQLCFWRSTTSTDNGKIIYERTPSGFTFSGASASSPGAVSSTAAYVRGSSGTFNTWFGSVSSTFPIRWLHVCAKDVSDGSFWLLGSSPQSAGSSQSAYNTFGFFSLNPANATDTEPYAFYVPAGSPTVDTLPASPSATWNDTMLSDSETYWWGWVRGTSWTWSALRPAFPSVITAGGARLPSTASGPYAALPVVFGKTASGLTELKGTAKWLRASYWNGRGDTMHDTVGPFRWVMVGSNATVGCLLFWDGKTPSMAYEY